MNSETFPIKANGGIMFRFILGTFCLLLTMATSNAVAVERAKVLERYSLVGVIAESTRESDKQGIVVIRDNQTKRNLTLRTGEMVSVFDKLKVSKVMRNQVQLVSGTQKITITYAGSTTKPSFQEENPNIDLDKLYIDELNDLENRYISNEDIVHIFDDSTETTPVEIKANDSARLWKPVRTGESLKYVIDINAETELSDDVIEEIFDDDY